MDTSDNQSREDASTEQQKSQIPQAPNNTEPNNQNKSSSLWNKIVSGILIAGFTIAVCIIVVCYLLSFNNQYIFIEMIIFLTIDIIITAIALGIGRGIYYVINNTGENISKNKSQVGDIFEQNEIEGAKPEAVEASGQTKN